MTSPADSLAPDSPVLKSSSKKSILSLVSTGRTPPRKSRQEIFAQLGLAVSPEAAPASVLELIRGRSSSKASSSTQLAICGPPAVASGSSSSAPKLSAPWLGGQKQAMVRLRNGVEQIAAMSMGPNGFCMAVFDDEEPFECELPNIMLEPVLATKAKAKGKSKAAAKAKGKAKAKAKAKGKAKSKAQGKAKAKSKAKAKAKGKSKATAPVPEVDYEDDVAEEAEEEPEVPPTQEYPEDIEEVVPAPSPAAPGQPKYQARDCKLGRYTAQSYVQCKVDSKWVLMAGVNEKQHPEHQAVCKDFYDRLMAKRSFTKTQASRLRDEVLAEWKAR